MVALALLLPTSTAALRPNTTLDPCRGHSFKAPALQDFREKTWRLPAWEKEAKKPKAVRAHRLHVRCAAGPGHRKAIRRNWRDDRRRFLEHRKRRLARQERLRYLPFDCGGGVRSAIPCGTMFCESGGSYTARNPSSSAGGRYQVIDSTWAAYGGQSYADSHPAAAAPPAEQDRIAAAIYADVGSSAWVCS